MQKIKSQKLIEDFSLSISIVVPILSKKSFTFLFGGQMGTGPFISEIGGNGIALTILTFTFIAFFSCDSVIVEIKLIIVFSSILINYIYYFSLRKLDRVLFL